SEAVTVMAPGRLHEAIAPVLLRRQPDALATREMLLHRVVAGDPGAKDLFPPPAIDIEKHRVPLPLLRAGLPDHGHASELGPVPVHLAPRVQEDDVTGGERHLHRIRAVCRAPLCRVPRARGGADGDLIMRRPVGAALDDADDALDV